MKTTFPLSDTRIVEVMFGLTIDLKVVDSRVPYDVFIAQGLTLAQYNEQVEFLKVNDHSYAMKMAIDKFCK